jgi:tetratricopeptide (TPR) repeat protein
LGFDVNRKTILLKSAVGMAALVLAAGCRSPEQKFAGFMATGKERLEKKDYSRAALEFRNASQVNPKNAEPYYQLSLVALAMGDFRNAVGNLRKTTELDPKHKDAQLKLAQLMGASQDKQVIQEAEKKVIEVLASSPADAETLTTLAAVEWRLGKAEEAEVHLNQAFEKWPQNLKSSLILARLKLSQKDVDGAEQILKKVVEASPGKVEPVIALGAFYRLVGRVPQAEQQFQQALKVDPKSGLAMVSLAGIKLRAGAVAEAEQFYKQASALGDPVFAPVHAVYLLQSGKQDLAIAEFEKLAKADPANRQTRNWLTNAYMATKRWAEAEKVLSAALEKNPKDLDALVQMSQIHLVRGDFLQAESKLTTVLKMESSSPMARYLMARVYRQRGAMARQRQELSEAVRLSPGFIQARTELAQVLIASNAAKAGLDLLDAAPESQRNLLPLLVQRNWAHLALGNAAEAAKGIQRALELAKRPDVLLQQAILKVGQQDIPGARRSLEEALKLNPEDVNALNLLVQTYGPKDQGEALRKVQEYASQRPNSARLQQFMGERLAKAGDLAGARNAFVAAKAANAGFSAADLSLAQLDVMEGKIGSAQQSLSARISANPSDVGARLLLAAIEERAANYSEAVEHYRKVIEVDERNVIALNNIAYLLAEYTRQPEDAVKYAEQAKEIAPDNPTVLDTLGWAYYRKGLYRTAVVHLESANSKQPSGVRKAHLGAAYIKTGDVNRGGALIEAAMKLDPKLSQSKAFQNMMAEIR